MQTSRRRVLGWFGGLAALAAAWAVKPGIASAHLPRPGQFEEDRFQGYYEEKHLYHVAAVDQQPLTMIMNDLNALQFSFGVDPDRIAIALGAHGTANLFGYNDAMWAKYKLGEKYKVIDPATGEPATRNIFWPQKNKDTSLPPTDAKSFYQDTTIQGLSQRGLKVYI